MWKAVSVILNCCFTASITYHDSLHGFQSGSSTGTATLEFRLLHQVMMMREAVLHTIFLYLHKAYTALDRSRCLDILEGYGMGTKALRLLCRYWARLHMVEQVGGYYGLPFRSERVMPQGDPFSPTIFNVVVDAVVHHWESLVAGSTGSDSNN